jgi:hypothetical protein
MVNGLHCFVTHENHYCKGDVCLPKLVLSFLVKAMESTTLHVAGKTFCRDITVQETAFQSEDSERLIVLCINKMIFV